MLNFLETAWAAGVHLNFRAGSTFPVPVCTVPSSMDRTSRCKVDAVRLYALYRLNLLLLKGQNFFYLPGSLLEQNRFTTVLFEPLFLSENGSYVAEDDLSLSRIWRRGKKSNSSATSLTYIWFWYFKFTNRNKLVNKVFI